MTTTRERPTLPELHRGKLKYRTILSEQRNVSFEALELASDRGLLWFGKWYDVATWFVTDNERVNCQARRLDGERWAHLEDNPKAQTLPGCWATWPLGIASAGAYPIIALVEGGGDLLAACHFIHCEHRDADVAPVGLLGAAQHIAAEALPLFAGKRVRIFPHNDEPGRRAAQTWTKQLSSVGAVVDCFSLAGLTTTAGAPVGDLNDLTSLDPDSFELDRELWGMLP